MGRMDEEAGKSWTLGNASPSCIGAGDGSFCLGRASPGRQRQRSHATSRHRARRTEARTKGPRQHWLEAFRKGLPAVGFPVKITSDLSIHSTHQTHLGQPPDRVFERHRIGRISCTEPDPA
jgi:hypothetical protein